MNTASINGSVRANGTIDAEVSANSALGAITIRGVTVVRGAKLLVDTTENWNLQTTFVPDEGMIIVYTDHERIEDQSGNVTFVPGLKIGDGNAYVVDLPFIDDSTTDQLLEHINDQAAHVSQQDRDFWNNKLNYNLSGETLTLNRN